MVAGGETDQGDWKSDEVIDLMDSTLKNEIYRDEKSKRVGSTGGLINNQPIICGGFGGPFDDYHQGSTYTVRGQSKDSYQMLEKRSCSSSVVLNQTNLWVTGGSEKTIGSTEFISLVQPPRKGPELPFTVFCHSMVLVDPKTIFLIGGLQNSQISKKTWIIDPTKNFEIKCGPDLNEARYGHSCSKMKIDEKIYLVVAGGFGNCKYLDSVEILDTTSLDQGWTLGNNFIFVKITKKLKCYYTFSLGPKLPRKIAHSTMVCSPTEKGVIIIGGRFHSDSNALIELSGYSKESLKWTTLKQKLSFPRYWHVSFLIPESIMKMFRMTI